MSQLSSCPERISDLASEREKLTGSPSQAAHPAATSLVPSPVLWAGASEGQGTVFPLGSPPR